MSASAVGDEPEDHRRRVGRERRVRMEDRLLRSVLEVFPENVGTASAVIDDIIKHADVSRGTFYKYFSSIDDAVLRVAARHVNDMLSAGVTVYHQVEGPKLRVACGFQLYLLRSLMDPRWGAFLTRISYLGDNEVMVKLIEDDINLGMKDGCFIIPDVQVAIDLLLGAKAKSIAKIIAGQADIHYVHAMTAHVLRSFGLDQASADHSVRKAYELMVHSSSGLVPWWRGDIVASWK